MIGGLVIGFVAGVGVTSVLAYLLLNVAYTLGWNQAEAAINGRKKPWEVPEDPPRRHAVNLRKQGA